MLHKRKRLMLELPGVRSLTHALRQTICASYCDFGDSHPDAVMTDGNLQLSQHACISILVVVCRMPHMPDQPLSSQSAQQLPIGTFPLTAGASRD